MKSLEWGSCAGEQIPQTGELLSDRNGDGVLRDENTMLPMLTIAHMQVDCRCLNDGVGKLDAADDASETAKKPHKTRQGKAGG